MGWEVSGDKEGEGALRLEDCMSVVTWGVVLVCGFAVGSWMGTSCTYRRCLMRRVSRYRLILPQSLRLGGFQGSFCDVFLEVRKLRSLRKWRKRLCLGLESTVVHTGRSSRLLGNARSRVYGKWKNTGN